MRAKELQTSTLEKQDILQFEIHLAAATNKATITESNSLLLAQLITNDPEGEFRRPPQSVLDSLAQANQHYKIGHLLCRSRSPDFLLDILQRQVNYKYFDVQFLTTFVQMSCKMCQIGLLKRGHIITLHYGISFD